MSASGPSGPLVLVDEGRHDPSTTSYLGNLPFKLEIVNTL